MLTGGAGSEGVYALLDVKLYFSAGFCVGSWMQNNKNTVQLEMTMSVVPKCKTLNKKDLISTDVNQYREIWGEQDDLAVDLA